MSLNISENFKTSLKIIYTIAILYIIFSLFTKDDEEIKEELIPEHTSDILEIDSTINNEIPCHEMTIKHYRYTKYGKLASIEALMLHEIETDYKFKNCRNEIDKAYVTYCDTYSEIIMRKITLILEGAYLYQQKHIEKTCKDNNLFASLKKHSKSFKIIDGAIKINPDNIFINPIQISSLKITPTKQLFGNFHVLSVLLSEGSDFNFIYKTIDEAEKSRSYILKLMVSNHELFRKQEP